MKNEDLTGKYQLEPTGQMNIFTVIPSFMFLTIQVKTQQLQMQFERLCRSFKSQTSKTYWKPTFNLTMQVAFILLKVSLEYHVWMKRVTWKLFWLILQIHKVARPYAIEGPPIKIIRRINKVCVKQFNLQNNNSGLI